MSCLAAGSSVGPITALAPDPIALTAMDICKRAVAAGILDGQRDEVVAEVGHGELRCIAHLPTVLAGGPRRRKRQQHGHRRAAFSERQGFLSRAGSLHACPVDRSGIKHALPSRLKNCLTRGLPGDLRVTTGYQRDSSSKRPMSSVTLVARAAVVCGKACRRCGR